jgi:hypothetical protein
LSAYTTTQQEGYAYSPIFIFRVSFLITVIFWFLGGDDGEEAPTSSYGGDGGEAAPTSSYGGDGGE